MQRQLFVAVNHGVAGVVAALITNDVVVFACDKIGNLAFTFVAPLGANQNGVRHVCASFQLLCRNPHSLLQNHFIQRRIGQAHRIDDFFMARQHDHLAMTRQLRQRAGGGRAALGVEVH